MCRRFLSLGAFVSGIAAATFVGMSAAHADDYIYSLYNPDFTQEAATMPFQNELLGTSGFDNIDVTTGVESFGYVIGSGNETLNPFTGAVENWDLNIISNLGPADVGTDFGLPVGSQIDVMELGNGFANQFVDAPGLAGAMNTITDTLVTPFGDYTLFSF